MVRKITPLEFEGAQQLRKEADEFVTDIFPKARIDLHIARFGGKVGLSARIIGDTTPHPLDDIVECLEELGVQRVFTVNPSTLDATQVPHGKDFLV